MVFRGCNVTSSFNVRFGGFSKNSSQTWRPCVEDDPACARFAYTSHLCLAKLEPMNPDDPEHLSPTVRSRFWRTLEHGEVEWLGAEYRTHRFTRHRHNTYALGTVEVG